MPAIREGEEARGLIEEWSPSPVGLVAQLGAVRSEGRASGRALVEMTEAAKLGDRDYASLGRRLDVLGEGGLAGRGDENTAAREVGVNLRRWGPETEPRTTLSWRDGENFGHSQGKSSGPPRGCSLLQPHVDCDITPDLGTRHRVGRPRFARRMVHPLFLI